MGGSVWDDEDSRRIIRRILEVLEEEKEKEKEKPKVLNDKPRAIPLED